MTRQNLASPANVRPDSDGDAAGSTERPTDQQAERPRAAERMHTLVLTGELDRASAGALEAAIEQLCEEGVGGITLDLSGLERIDSTGVAVIAFRSKSCARRGHQFALRPGSPSVQRVFELAGQAECLPFLISEDGAARAVPVVLAVQDQPAYAKDPSALDADVRTRGRSTSTRRARRLAIVRTPTGGQ